MSALIALSSNGRVPEVEHRLFILALSLLFLLSLSTHSLEYHRGDSLVVGEAVSQYSLDTTGASLLCPACHLSGQLKLASSLSEPLVLSFHNSKLSLPDWGKIQGLSPLDKPSRSPPLAV